MPRDVSRCAVQDAPETWKSWLSLAELWYHTSLGCSPFKALYGVEANVGAGLVLQPNTPQSVVELVEYKELHLQSLKKHLDLAQNKMKVMADKKRSNI